MPNQPVFRRLSVNLRSESRPQYKRRLISQNNADEIIHTHIRRTRPKTITFNNEEPLIKAVLPKRSVILMCLAPWHQPLIVAGAVWFFVGYVYDPPITSPKRVEVVSESGRSGISIVGVGVPDEVRQKHSLRCRVLWRSGKCSESVLSRTSVYSSMILKNFHGRSLGSGHCHVVPRTRGVSHTKPPTRRWPGLSCGLSKHPAVGAPRLCQLLPSAKKKPIWHVVL